MSSRRASMNAFQNQITHSGIDFGVNGHGDQVAPAEAPTFYRILLGHQHEIAVGEFEISRPKTVMVGERMRRESETHARKLLEKPLWIADSRDRVQPLSRQLGARHGCSSL